MATIAKSYFSLFTTANSNASADAFSVFDEDNYSSYASTQTKTSDISYSSSTGRITFSEAGTYLIIVNAAVRNHGTAADTVDILTKINGTEISDVEPFRFKCKARTMKRPRHTTLSKP